ncbi:MAG TPA: hypothetical protein VFH63_06925 [candidate division Zixibacteria bacterium]|nr:hypothetical protein [candidate division Zixibacteria bacterium]
MSDETARSGGLSTGVLGIILIGVGLLFLAGQLLDVDWGAIGWPVFIILPGLALVLLGLTTRSDAGLTVAGSIVTVVGLLLLYQNTTGHWESWAYVWALVAPGGSGIGMLLHGIRAGEPATARAGLWQVVTALGIAAVGFIFFEGIIGISGNRLALPEWLLPAVIIVLGVLVLLRAVVSREPEDGLPA